MGIPGEVDISEVMAWREEQIRAYILGLQETLQGMRPVVGAAQEWVMGGMTSEQAQEMVQAVQAYRRAPLPKPKVDGRARSVRDAQVAVVKEPEPAEYEESHSLEFWKREPRYARREG